MNILAFLEKCGKMIKVGDVDMINFIICDDEQELRKITKDKVIGFMMNYDIDYKIHEFSCYDSKFEQIASKDSGFKVYFLDIKTNKGSGLDAARIIREKYEDWNSIIIIMTSYSEYKYEALSSRLMLLDFVNKLDNYDKKIREDLEISMKYYDKKYNTLDYEYNHTYYKIEYRHIICIEKEPDSKRCIIRTKDGEQLIPGTLNSVYERLDDRFLKTHKSMIININEIAKYEIKSNKVTFKNGDYTHLVARDKKKELISHVCNDN